MGIFSATHRDIAREAMDCVFRRIRFKPCESGLDKRLKSAIIGKVMKLSPGLAGFGFRHFDIIAWVFTILMFGSTYWSGMSVYRYAMYGNCHGKDSTEECDFNGLVRVLDQLDQQKKDVGTAAVEPGAVQAATGIAPASAETTAPPATQTAVTPAPAATPPQPSGSE
jgi:hypothetical protein